MTLVKFHITSKLLVDVMIEVSSVSSPVLKRADLKQISVIWYLPISCGRSANFLGFRFFPPNRDVNPFLPEDVAGKTNK